MDLKGINLKTGLRKSILFFLLICMISFGNICFSLDRKFALPFNCFAFSDLKSDSLTKRQYWELQVNEHMINLDSLKDCHIVIKNKNTGHEYTFKADVDFEIRGNKIIIPKPDDSDCSIKSVYNVKVGGARFITGGEATFSKDLCVVDNLGIAKKFGITSELYRIDYKNRVIKGIHPHTSVMEFIRKISFKGYRCLIRKGNGAILGINDKLATGDVIDFISNKKVKYRFSIAVLGDLTGIGNISKESIKICEKYIMGEVDLKQPFLSAADLNGDGKVDSADLILMKKCFPLPYN